MSDTFTLVDPTNSQSTQGALSSQYTNWLTDQIVSAAEWIAYTWWSDQGGNVDDIPQAQAIQTALENGDFSLADLFNVANGKTSNEGDIAGSPDPKLIVGDVTIDLAELGLLSGEETTQWTSGNTKNTVYHQREYLTEFTSDTPPPSWDEINPPVNEAPEVLQVVDVFATETESTYDASHTIINQDLPDDTDPKTVNLLDSAYVTDADPLTVTGITFYDSNNNPISQPDFISWNADGTFTIEQNSELLNELPNGEKLVLKATYTISDGTNPDVENTINIEITGTEDQWKASETDTVFNTHTRTGSGSGQVFNDQILSVDPTQVPENSIDEQNFVGTLTLATNGGFTATNQNSQIDDSGVVDWGNAELDTLQVFGINNSDSTNLLAGALNDGEVTYSGNISGNSPVGAQVTVTLEYTYDYWFLA